MTYTKEQAKQKVTELVALRGKRIENKGEEGKRGIIIPKDMFKEFIVTKKVESGAIRRKGLKERVLLRQ